MRLKDLTGCTFGDLLVIERAGSMAGSGLAAWRCWCSCGTECVRAGNELRLGRTTHCGCKTSIHSSLGHSRHGQSHRPTWRSWSSMVNRCTKEWDPSWDRYGGRGIRVCPQWLGPDGFRQFLVDMDFRPSRAHTIDRKDVNGNYEPTNCRWATKREQSNNRRDNRRITFAGRSMTVVEWARERGIRKGTLTRRLDAGWSVHDALMAPIDGVRRAPDRPAT